MDTNKIEISSALLDGQQVRMLLEASPDDAESLFKEIIELFREESAVNLDSIEGAIGAEDRYKLGRSIHALAGSSANIGAQRLSEAAKLAEEAVSEAEFSLMKAELGGLRRLRDETLAEYEQILGQLRS